MHASCMCHALFSRRRSLLDAWLGAFAWRCLLSHWVTTGLSLRGRLLPAQNRDDPVDLRPEVTEDLEFDFVEDLSEVFRITLRPT